MRKPLVMFAKKGANINVNNLQEAKALERIGVLHSSVSHDYLLK